MYFFRAFRFYCFQLKLQQVPQRKISRTRNNINFTLGLKEGFYVLLYYNIYRLFVCLKSWAKNIRWKIRLKS